MTVDLTEEFDTQRAYIYYPPEEVDFDPAAWNFAEIIDTTGDYAYSLNLPLLGEAKVGSLYQRPFMDTFKIVANEPPVVTSDALHEKLLRDDLHYLGNHIKKCLPETGHVIAFFARPIDSDGVDRVASYERTLKLRRDSNGCWSYRARAGCPSPSVPTQKDWREEKIVSLETADLGPYKKFLGYATIPYHGISY